MRTSASVNGAGRNKGFLRRSAILDSIDYLGRGVSQNFSRQNPCWSMAICCRAHWGVEGVIAPEFGLLIRAGELWQNRGGMWRRRLYGGSASN